jgi:hypothetical protein
MTKTKTSSGNGTPGKLSSVQKWRWRDVEDTIDDGGAGEFSSGI